MNDLPDFLLGPIARVPWRVTVLFGVVLGLSIIFADSSVVSIPAGLATCCAAGFVGASRGREFDQGLLAVIGAILIGNLIGLIAALRASAFPLDLPLLGMLLLGVPVGTVGAGVGAWVSYRLRRISGSSSSASA
jgi:hypothetical protein